MKQLRSPEDWPWMEIVLIMIFAVMFGIVFNLFYGCGEVPGYNLEISGDISSDEIRCEMIDLGTLAVAKGDVGCVVYISNESCPIFDEVIDDESKTEK